MISLVIIVEKHVAFLLLFVQWALVCWCGPTSTTNATLFIYFMLLFNGILRSQHLLLLAADLFISALFVCLFFWSPPPFPASVITKNRDLAICIFPTPYCVGCVVLLALALLRSMLTCQVQQMLLLLFPTQQFRQMSSSSSNCECPSLCGLVVCGLEASNSFFCVCMCGLSGVG